MIIGLTGGIGSGKSAASRVFESLGIGCVDADVVARDVVAKGSPALSAIAERFGSDILTTKGQLNRASLRERIFTSNEDKTWLEALLHPLIREQILAQLKQQPPPYSVLVAPLLFENGLEALCDETVLIDVPESVQRQRVTQRDSVNADQVQRIIDSQMGRADKQARATHYIENTGTLAQLETAILALHHHFVAKNAQ
ncbi:dephospho-CoA kinase [Saccharospirillum alexandrii]|uniref:dephospho-CoA kinase n=1 Tax=Saccharospirillum alexandrii TaxID=2448477 RepID=UPI000FD9470F|nr:dephospho-CoA kinase [Saccharospirillum alexandrii]